MEICYKKLMMKSSEILLSSKTVDFVRRQIRHNSTIMMSFCVQQVNVGHGLLVELPGVRPFIDERGSEN